MVTFKQYFLTENIVFGIHDIKALGLSSLARDPLPTSPPYGFWVDKHGNFKVIPSFSSGGHAKAAKEIIMSAFDYKDAKGEITDNDEREFSKAVGAGFNSLYKILFELNYMHVVLGGNTYYHYNDTGRKITIPQERFMDDLRRKYGTAITLSTEIL